MSYAWAHGLCNCASVPLNSTTIKAMQELSDYSGPCMQDKKKQLSLFIGHV